MVGLTGLAIFDGVVCAWNTVVRIDYQFSVNNFRNVRLLQLTFSLVIAVMLFCSPRASQRMCASLFSASTPLISQHAINNIDYGRGVLAMFDCSNLHSVSENTTLSYCFIASPCTEIHYIPSVMYLLHECN
jgi:hypothetical protein